MDFFSNLEKKIFKVCHRRLNQPTQINHSRPAQHNPQQHQQQQQLRIGGGAGSQSSGASGSSGLSVVSVNIISSTPSSGTAMKMMMTDAQRDSGKKNFFLLLKVRKFDEKQRFFWSIF